MFHRANADTEKHRALGCAETRRVSPQACARLGRWWAAPGAGVGAGTCWPVTWGAGQGVGAPAWWQCPCAGSGQRPRSTLSEVRLGSDPGPPSLGVEPGAALPWQAQRRTPRRRCSRALSWPVRRMRGPTTVPTRRPAAGGVAPLQAPCGSRGRRQPLLRAQRHHHRRRAGRQEGVREAPGVAGSGRRRPLSASTPSSATRSRGRSDSFTRKTRDARAAEQRRRVGHCDPAGASASSPATSPLPGPPRQRLARRPGGQRRRGPRAWLGPGAGGESARGVPGMRGRRAESGAARGAATGTGSRGPWPSALRCAALRSRERTAPAALSGVLKALAAPRACGSARGAARRCLCSRLVLSFLLEE